MGDLRYYYRFEAVGIDYTLEKDVKKYSNELTSFREISDRFRQLKSAFDGASNERCDLAVNIFPDLFGVTEISVYHKIKRKLFSKEIKKQCFFICVTSYEGEDEDHALYEYETQDIDEVERIFATVITDKAKLDVSGWKRVL